MTLEGALACAASLYALLAAWVLARKARGVLEWPLPYHWALLGQFVITAAALAAALALVWGAYRWGQWQAEVLALLALVAFLAFWHMALGPLIAWLSNLTPDPRLLSYRLSRLKRDAVLGTLLAASIAGTGGLWLLDLAMSRGPGVAHPVPRHDREATANSASDASRAQDTAAVSAAVHAWAAAWSRQDAAGYLAAYAPDFRTPNGEPRVDWETGRRVRIARPRQIAVAIDMPRIEFVGASTAVVRFRQRYLSDLVSETTDKTLVMTYRGGRWLIREERRS